MPDTRLTVDNYPDGYVDAHFHSQYRGIVGSLGWIVGMTRPDCSFAHASLSRFVQYPGPVHMQAASRVLAYLRGTIDQCLVFTRPSIASPITITSSFTITCGGGLTRTIQDAKTRAHLIQAMWSYSMARPSHGGANGRRQCRCRQQRASSLRPANAARRSCTYVKFSKDLWQNRTVAREYSRTIRHALLCHRTLCTESAQGTLTCINAQILCTGGRGGQ